MIFTLKKNVPGAQGAEEHGGSLSRKSIWGPGPRWVGRKPSLRGSLFLQAAELVRVRRPGGHEVRDMGTKRQCPRPGTVGTGTP